MASGGIGDYHWKNLSFLDVPWPLCEVIDLKQFSMYSDRLSCAQSGTQWRIKGSCYRINSNASAGLRISKNCDQLHQQGEHMTGVEFLAWWGAIVSTMVLAWDIYKWKTTGAKLNITYSVDMESYNIPEYEGKKLITANISNVGDRATTITTVALVFYKSRLHKICGKSNKVFFLPFPSTAQPLPFIINPGAIWTAIGEQDEEVKKMAAEGVLTWQVFHSQNKKPVSTVIEI